MTNEDRAVLRAQLAATRRLIEKAKTAPSNETMATYLDLALESLDDVVSTSKTVTRGSRRPKNNGVPAPEAAAVPAPELAAPPTAPAPEPAPVLVAP